MERKTVILVGVGRMGGAMLGGWVKNMGAGFQFYGIDPHPSAAAKQAQNDGQFIMAERAADLPESAPASVIVLATKPQMVPEAIRELKGQIGPQTLIISVAAGVTSQTITDSAIATQPVVRAMPNIGALVGHSVTAAFASKKTSGEHRALADKLFTAIGQFNWVEQEADLHTVTAISGSGPAYFFAFCEAMIEAALAEGLETELAKSLVLGTISTSGRLLEETPDPALLRRTVTSPNGTTAAALDAFSKDRTLQRVMTAAVAAAANRSKELAG